MKCYKKDYPRPQFVRDNWVNLNGTWDFGFDDENCGEKEAWYEKFAGNRQIQVPFTYETSLSGIGEEEIHENVWYRRSFTAKGEELCKKRLRLHFEGSDFITKVWVNGSFAGSHRGGYSRFSFDVTEFVKDGENELVVKVEDSTDIHQPRGKQRWIKENFACWYVQTTGIWKTVWMEYVPKISLDSVKITPVLTDNAVELEYEIKGDSACLGEELLVEAVVSFDGMFVAKSVSAMTASHVRTVLDVSGTGENAFV